MKKPTLHPKESERLVALAQLEIMDTLAEQEFDELTLIASQICNTPIALISLVDDKRQWFKSKVGLGANETPKDIAFCAHAILQDEVFVIEDSFLDERFSDNPLATGAPHVRFYAGAPLISPSDNLPLGTLCVIDNQPRIISDSQKKTLMALSHQVTKLLELRAQVAILKAANDKLIFQKAAFDNMYEGVVLQDQNGKIIDFNPSALKVLGLSADQLIGKTSLDPDWQAITDNGSPFPGEQHPAMMALKTAQVQKNVIMGIKSNSNSPKWISITSIPIFMADNKTPTHAVTTFEDITIQRQSQQALFQSAKMTSLGEMAGGIAHEINTPLAIICSAVDHVQKLVNETPIKSDVINQKLVKVEATTMRIAQIIKGLRTFSRDSENDPLETTTINLIIQDTISLCAEKFKNHGVEIQLNLIDDVYIQCIPIQVSQVILNLMNNSFDAIVSLQEKWVRIDISQVEKMAKMTFTDSGSGINVEIQNKIMQPFFTTKEVGKGTGLGLSISKSIIEKLNGKFYYDSENKNTCFIIELPVSPKIPKKEIS
jgi:PAS domain S-box-containing protein